jgi:hypothetical protein
MEIGRKSPEIYGTRLFAGDVERSGGRRIAAAGMQENLFHQKVFINSS